MNMDVVVVLFNDLFHGRFYLHVHNYNFAFVVC